MKKISLTDAGRLNDEKRDEILKKLEELEATIEEIQKEINEIWSDIAKNIDYNL